MKYLKTRLRWVIVPTVRPKHASTSLDKKRAILSIRPQRVNMLFSLTAFCFIITLLISFFSLNHRAITTIVLNLYPLKILNKISFVFDPIITISITINIKTNINKIRFSSYITPCVPANSLHLIFGSDFK